MPSPRRPGQAALAALLVVAACDADPSNAPAASSPVRDREIRLDAVAGFADVGGPVTGLALLPNAEAPWLGRILASLETGGFAVLDLNDSKILMREGPRAGSLAIAPDFTLRGTRAPLVIVAGGALAAPQAFVFIAEGDVLAPAPVEPIAPDSRATGLCIEKSSAAIVDVIVFSDALAERWRLRDTGADALKAENLGPVESVKAAAACAPAAFGAPVALGLDGRLARFGAAEGDWSTTAAGGSDLAIVGSETGTTALVARPEAGSIDAVALDHEAQRSRLVIETAMNAPGARSPKKLAVSAVNFGGVFAEGLMAVSDGPAVSVLALPSVLEAIAAPLEDTSPNTP